MHDLLWGFIKSIDDADKKNGAKKHELRTKNPENKRYSKIKCPHAQRKMVCPHVEVFFCHAAHMGFVFGPALCPQHKGNMGVEPERRGKAKECQKEIQQQGQNF